MTPGEMAPEPAEGGERSDRQAESQAVRARKATQTARESTARAAAKTKATTGKAAKAAKDSAAKAAETVRAVRAARAGRIEEARAIASEAELDEGAAGKAIAEAEALHYQAEVIKRGLNVNALTTTLNERWDNGWRLAHVLEQRGNTVLVFEKQAQ